MLPGADDDDCEKPVQTMIYFNAPDRQVDRGMVRIDGEKLSNSCIL
jgi:hypothetical protein